MRGIYSISVLGSAMAALSSMAAARELVVLPGVVNPVGVTSGVDTTGPGTLTVGSNQDVNTGNDAGGAITTDAANTANVVFTGTSNVTGFVGKTGTTFLNIAAGANASTVTFGGPVYATTFSESGTGTVNFNGGFTSNTGSTMDFAGNGFINVGPGQTVKAAITNSAGANTGTLTLNGNSILDGAVGAASGLKQINVVGGNALITGQVKAGTYNLGTNTLNVAGAFAVPVAGTINTTIFSQAIYGKVVPIGAATIGNALQVNVNVTGPITNGTSFNIVDSTSGTNGSTVTATSNTLRYTFSAVPTANGRVIITTTQIPLAVVVTPVVVPPAVTPVAPLIIAPVIDALPVTPTTAPVLTAITLLPTATAVASALAQLGPSTTNLVSPRVSYRATQRFQDLWGDYMEKTQEACDLIGQSKDRQRRQLADASACRANDMRSHVWGTAFGYFGEQDTVKGFEGYDFHILGAMLGYDVPLSEATRAGVGLRYARSTLNGQASDTHGRINSYQATAYLGYAPGPWFADAAFVYGFDDYSGSRRIVFPGVDSTAKANYGGHQYTGYGTAGYHFYVGDGRTVITPYATLQYTRLHVAAYSETGGGAIDLNVNAQNYEFAQAGVGAKLARAFPLSGDQVVRPELHANWLRSLGGETMKDTAGFVSGGPTFAVVGLKPNRNTYDVGAGVVLAKTGAWSLEGVYDYQWRADSYRGHQVMVNLVLPFGGERAHKEAAAASSPPPPPPPPPPARAPIVAPAPPPVPSKFLVFFDFDKANLRTDAQMIVREAADYANRTGKATITATGHTDTVGTPAYNMGLSERRAEAVKAALVKLGISDREIVVRWKGESEPLVATGDGVREPQNRRVEIILE